MVDMASVQTWLRMVWTFPGVQVITLLVVLNLALSVAVAIRTAQFSVRVLGEFLWRQLGPYVITYFVFRLASEGTGFEWVSGAVLALIVGMLTAKIIENLHDLGVPIPAGIMSLVQRPPVTVSFVAEGKGTSDKQ